MRNNRAASQLTKMEQTNETQIFRHYVSKIHTEPFGLP